MKKTAFLTLLMLTAFAIFAQETEQILVFEDDEIILGTSEAPAVYSDNLTDRWIISYNLGLEYTYAIDMPFYESIPAYQLWRDGMKNISVKLIDNLGKQGHIIRFANQLEWRKNKFSFTAFANLTLNYIPAFLDVSLDWVPACLKGGLACFKAALDVWGWALKDGWLLLNIVTIFTIPVFLSGCCVLGGILCFLALPVSVVILAVPMASLGGSIDYHPYTNDLLDTKLSLGLDIDGYRGMLHAGFFGLFTQAEAAVLLNNLRLYAQAGYRVDALNVYTAVKSKSVEDAKNASRYVPAPYLRAGISWSFGNK